MKKSKTNSDDPEDLDEAILKLMRQKEEENKALIKMLKNIDENLNNDINTKKSNTKK